MTDALVISVGCRSGDQWMINPHIEWEMGPAKPIKDAHAKNE